jgi:GH18 family chitinase
VRWFTRIIREVLILIHTSSLVGGWTYSPKFHPVVVSPSLRARFVESSIALLEDYGLDGLDVDYEYPSDDSQAKGYVDLLHELRRALDEHAAKKGANYRFLLTVSDNFTISMCCWLMIRRLLHHVE